MAFDPSKIVWQKRGQEGSRSSNGVRTYTGVLQLQSDSAADSPSDALDAAANFLGIPAAGPVYVAYSFGTSFDPLAMLKKMTARCTATGSTGEYKEWLVTCEYDSTAEQMQDNPLLRPTHISGSFQEYMKAIWKDVDGKTIVNKANQPFDPPIELPDGRPHLVMTRNEIDYSLPYFANNFVNRINSSPWYFGSTGQWRCVNVGGDGPNIENDVVFYTVTYEFQFRYEGWQPSISNRGKIQKDGTPCVDVSGNITDEPQYLDDNGKQLPFPVSASSETFVNPTCFFTADFNALGLP